MKTIHKFENGDEATALIFNTPLGDCDDNFTEIQGILDAQEGDIEDIGESISTIQGDISGLDERVDALEEGGEGEGSSIPYDNIIHERKDAATVTVKVGKITNGDGLNYVIEADTDINFASNLDTGTEQASKFYYIWVGLIDAAMALRFSLSATAPTGMVDALRLRGGVRNNASSNIVEYVMSQFHLRYGGDMAVTGSDETGISLTISTSFVDVDLSAFVPAGNRMCTYGYNNGGNSLYERMKGSSASSGLSLSPNTIRSTIMKDGIFQAKCNTSATHAFTVIAYSL